MGLLPIDEAEAAPGDEPYTSASVSLTHAGSFPGLP